MWKRRAYYHLKPIIPWRLRMGLRRILAQRKRQNHQADWPINESARTKPKGWPGWPAGKQFAVILTHDVEGPDGLAKCRKLAELEMELGFRSSFNFIPEGSYRVSRDLRSWLVSHGFEVGVHDLQHDGKLFHSRAGYERKAAQINHYLKEWNAVGFRAGFMLRNLDWFHDLNIRYDASTFDTDPFEPQSDGAETIFPFWVSAKSANATSKAPPLASEGKNEAKGYLELPYTLPQDSTLFLVLREKAPSIWLEKTDWLAAQGGMVLLNVHPDYVRFDGEAVSARTFSEQHYRELLEHIRSRYAGNYWQPLARNLTTWFQDTMQHRNHSTHLPFLD